MITTQEIDKKNEIIEKSITLRLEHLLEIKKKVEASTTLKIFYKAMHLSGSVLHELTEGIITLEAIQFRSVDDFNSIRKLREAELFFSKNKVLKNLTYSHYTSQINPIFLTYVDIEIQLDALLYKADDLAYRGFSLAATTAQELISNFKKLNLLCFEEKKMNYSDYKSRALTCIAKARPLLEQHRGYKELLGNLVLLILTLGTAFIVNKAVKGHFFFFRETKTSKQLDALNHMVLTLNV